MGRGELKHPGHAFLRALRRGFGIYIDDASFPKYRRIVQKLAQQGKLAFVFSDESLAYGVNMPFRTCCFCESMDGILTPLLAQQMSGRAGRRGLDTQVHGILYYINYTYCMSYTT
jgi:ATP-dependent RNA helicase DDX60